MDIAEREIEEIWKSPPSLDMPWVEVSNLGRIRTLDHKCLFSRMGKKQMRQRKGRIRKLCTDSRGRPAMTFFSRGVIGERIIIGRLLRSLVAECFLPDYSPDLYVFYKNSDISDCRAENLRMGTKKERYAISGAASSTNVVEVRKDGQTVGVFNGCGAVGRFLGVTKQTVWADIKAKGKCKGYELVAYEPRIPKASALGVCQPKLREKEAIRQAVLEQILREMSCQE